MRHAALVLALAVLPGCTFAKIEGSGGKPLVLNQLGTASAFRPFEVSEVVAFDWTGSIEVDDILRRSPEVALGRPEASHVQNVRVEIGADVQTFFINLFTIGLANARVVTIRGEIVESAPPPRPQQ